MPCGSNENRRQHVAGLPMDEVVARTSTPRRIAKASTSSLRRCDCVGTPKPLTRLKGSSPCDSRPKSTPPSHVAFVGLSRRTNPNEEGRHTGKYRNNRKRTLGHR